MVAAALAELSVVGSDGVIVTRRTIAGDTASSEGAVDKEIGFTWHIQFRTDVIGAANQTLQNYRLHDIPMLKVDGSGLRSETAAAVAVSVLEETKGAAAQLDVLTLAAS